MKRLLLASIALVMVFTLAITAYAHPYSIKCPRDGQDMYFTHQVGYGKDAYC